MKKKEGGTWERFGLNVDLPDLGWKGIYGKETCWITSEPDIFPMDGVSKLQRLSGCDQSFILSRSVLQGGKLSALDTLVILVEDLHVPRLIERETLSAILIGPT